MAIYALEITTLLAWLSKLHNESTEQPPSGQVGFADCLKGVDPLENLKKCWNLLGKEDGKFGYRIKASKSHIIVKEQYQEKAKQIFPWSKIRIITEGHRYLGSIIGSKVLKGSYINTLIAKWCEELTQLPKFTMKQPQAAYAAFTSWYKHKFPFFMRTIRALATSSHL